jgi:hypothetical protein
MELFDLATTLRQQLFDSRDDFGKYPPFEKDPALVDRLISKLTYVVRDAAPRYMAVDLSSATPGEDSFRITVYTDDHLFHLVYDPAVDHIVTTVVARSTLRHIELLSAPNFMKGEARGEFKGDVEVEAFYDQFIVRLPGDSGATVSNKAKLDSFIVSLLRDLTHT